LNYKNKNIILILYVNVTHLRKKHPILVLLITANVLSYYCQQRQFGQYQPERLPKKPTLCIDNDSNYFL